MQQPPNRRAPREDWDVYRQEITNLYITEKKTLANVMDTMEKEHNFHATVQMYKKRIKKWGLQKNNRRSSNFSQLPYRMSDRPGARNNGTVTTQGVGFGSERVHRYSYRELIMKPGQANSIPPPRHLESPDVTKIPESFIHSFHQYADGCRADTLPLVCIKAWSWNNRVLLADLVFAEGRVKTAFELLGPCFDELTSFMRDPNPLVFIYIYLASLKLPPEVGQKLLSHAVNLSRTGILEECHPVKRMLAWLRTERRHQARENARHVIFAYHDILEKSMRWRPIDLVMARMRSYVVLANLGLFEYESLETLYRQTMKRLSEAGYTGARFVGDEVLRQLSKGLESPDLFVDKAKFLWYLSRCEKVLKESCWIDHQ